MGVIVRHQVDDAGTVVLLAGDLDAFSATTVRSGLRRAAPRADQRVLVDMAEVSFLDSSGLGVLLGFRKEVLATGGTVLIGRPSGVVRRVLALTGVDRLFPIDGAQGAVPAAGTAVRPS